MLTIASAIAVTTTAEHLYWHIHRLLFAQTQKHAHTHANHTTPHDFERVSGKIECCVFDLIAFYSTSKLSFNRSLPVWPIGRFVLRVRVCLFVCYVWWGLRYGRVLCHPHPPRSFYSTHPLYISTHSIYGWASKTVDSNYKCPNLSIHSIISLGKAN